MFATQSVAETLAALRTTEKGLSTSEVETRRATEGFNEIPEKRRSLLLLFLQQFQDIFVYILIGALVISAALPFFEEGALDLEGFIDAFVILAILLLNALLGFVQEYKAEEAIAMLQKLTAPNSRVRRDGKEAIIPSRELVPGDVVILEAGDRIAADGRLIVVSHFEVNESSMTGESQPSSKKTDVLEGKLSLADQTNMAFAGTLVTRGSAEMVVTTIALKTEIGKIAELVSVTKVPTTPLEERMARLSKMLGYVVMGLCGLVVVVGLLYGFSFLEMLLIGVSLAVSAVPEGLPAVITVCLAVGVRQMVKRNVLVRKLESLETLGSVTVICSDKTGTITENRMRVTDLWTPADPALGKTEKERQDLLAQIAASCNRASLPNFGDPTEIGLLQLAKERGVERLQIDDEEVPFTSEEKYMQTRHGKRVFLKGAPEKILKLVAPKDRKQVEEHNAAMAARGLRVLGCAVKEGGKAVFAGLVAMEDPPRKGVKEAVLQAKVAGIRSIMITGDNVVTAASIARSVGIEGDSMEGKDLEDVTPETLREIVKTTSVFARVSPVHKLRILEALQANGEIVAMSGDGVNDAPALKGAHVGVAMGKNGTQIAREAGSIVLTDDNFVTIVAAVSEGRHIYDNIRKFILFLMRTNFYELLFFLVTILLNLPLPYLPLHILWINLMTDGLPALALSLEPAEKDIMERPPRKREEHIFAGQWGKLVLAAVIPFCIGFVILLWQLSEGVPIEEIRTKLFTFAILFQLLFTFTIRSRQSIWEIGPFSNKWLLGAIAVPFMLQLLILYTPANEIFKLVPLTLTQFLSILAVSSSGLIVFEVLKVIERKWGGNIRIATS